MNHFIFDIEDSQKDHLQYLHNSILNKLNSGCKCKSSYDCLSPGDVRKIIDHYNNSVIIHKNSKKYMDFENAYAGVSKLEPNIIYFTSKFYLLEDETEQLRILIHEITHTMGWTHEFEYGDPKYFYEPPLLAEKCITGIATLASMNAKCFNLNNKFII